MAHFITKMGELHYEGSQESKHTGAQCASPAVLITEPFGFTL